VKGDNHHINILSWSYHPIYSPHRWLWNAGVVCVISKAGFHHPLRDPGANGRGRRLMKQAKLVQGKGTWEHTSDRLLQEAFAFLLLIGHKTIFCVQLCFYSKKIRRQIFVTNVLPRNFGCDHHTLHEKTDLQ